MQFPKNLEHYLEYKLKHGGGVLPNTPTEDFENVLFWTFNKSVVNGFPMELKNSSGFEVRDQSTNFVEECSKK